MLIYFTRIDLIFRQLNSPSIRLRLRDIFIATRPFRFQNVEPHLSGSLVRTPLASGNLSATTNQTPPTAPSRPYLNALRAINELGVYFYAESKTFANSDLMLVITGQDLCADSSDSPWASAGSHYDSCSYATIKGKANGLFFVYKICLIWNVKLLQVNLLSVELVGRTKTTTVNWTLQS